MDGQESVTVKYWLTVPKILRGHRGSALSHIKSGVKIVTEVEHNDGNEQHQGVLVTSQHPFVDFRELEILFNRLDYQVAQVCRLFSSFSNLALMGSVCLFSETVYNC